jgi:polyhydroxyalkanoate synthesis regulator phasin
MDCEGPNDGGVDDLFETANTDDPDAQFHMQEKQAEARKSAFQQEQQLKTDQSEKAEMEDKVQELEHYITELQHKLQKKDE